MIDISKKLDQELWNRISDFKLDNEYTQPPFTEKLMAENQWSRYFALRAIDEYKRFMYLCAVLPNGASPPKVVDEVWHLHLTYTQNYWYDFCGKNLLKDIHHIPSSGGKDDLELHKRWYQDTREQYKFYFEESPPDDIWPDPNQKLEKPNFRLVKKWGSIYVAISWLMPIVLSFILFQKLNPYKVNGEKFLIYYSLLGFYTIIAGWLYKKIRNSEYTKYVSNNFTDNLTPYQVAYYAGKYKHAYETCLVNLIVAKKIIFENGVFVIQKDPPIKDIDDQANPFRKCIAHLADGERIDLLKNQNMTNVRDFQNTEAEKLSFVENPLKDNMGLIILCLVAIVRITQGINNHKPVSYLIILLILFTVIFVVLLIVFTPGFIETRNKSIKAFYQKKWLNNSNYIHSFVIEPKRTITLNPELLFLYDIFFPAIVSASNSTGDAGTSSDGGSCGSSCGGGCGGCGGGGD